MKLLLIKDVLISIIIYGTYDISRDLYMKIIGYDLGVRVSSKQITIYVLGCSDLKKIIFGPLMNLYQSEIEAYLYKLKIL